MFLGVIVSFLILLTLVCAASDLSCYSHRGH